MKNFKEIELSSEVFVMLNSNLRGRNTVTTSMWACKKLVKGKGRVSLNQVKRSDHYDVPFAITENYKEKMVHEDVPFAITENYGENMV